VGVDLTDEDEVWIITGPGPKWMVRAWYDTGVEVGLAVDVEADIESNQTKAFC
jgi:hypothetical protein